MREHRGEPVFRLPCWLHAACSPDAAARPPSPGLFLAPQTHFVPSYFKQSSWRTRSPVPGSRGPQTSLLAQGSGAGEPCPGRLPKVGWGQARGRRGHWHPGEPCGLETAAKLSPWAEMPAQGRAGGARGAAGAAAGPAPSQLQAWGHWVPRSSPQQRAGTHGACRVLRGWLGAPSPRGHSPAVHQCCWRPPQPPRTPGVGTELPYHAWPQAQPHSPAPCSKPRQHL